MTTMKDMVSKSRLLTDETAIEKGRKMIETMNAKHSKEVKSMKKIHTDIHEIQNSTGNICRKNEPM